MKTQFEIYKIYDYKMQYIVIGKKVYGYVLGFGFVWDFFNIKKILSDDVYYQQTINTGFLDYEVVYKDLDSEQSVQKNFYIPLTKEFVEYYEINWDKGTSHEGSIILSNKNLRKYAESFYELYLEIEIQGYRTRFETNDDYSSLYIEIPKSEMTRDSFNAKFGIPQTIEELEDSEQLYYIIHPTDIDKIIGIKRYRDISTIGETDGEQFTGEVEELVLDFHNYNEEIYQILNDHDMLNGLRYKE